MRQQSSKNYVKLSYSVPNQKFVNVFTKKKYIHTCLANCLTLGSFTCDPLTHQDEGQKWPFFDLSSFSSSARSSHFKELISFGKKKTGVGAKNGSSLATIPKQTEDEAYDDFHRNVQKGAVELEREIATLGTCACLTDAMFGGLLCYYPLEGFHTSSRELSTYSIVFL